MTMTDEERAAKMKDLEEKGRALNDAATPATPKPGEPPTEKGNPYAWLTPEVLRPISAREGGAEWLTRPPPRREYLLSFFRDADREKREPIGFIASGRVGLLASAGGVGKSHALCQLALAVAVSDLERALWLGAFEVDGDKAGRVLLVMGEEDADEIRRRLFNAADVMKLKPKQREIAAQRIVPLGLAGHAEVAMTKQLGPGIEADAETLFSETLRQHLTNVGEKDGGKWSCVIIDPMARFAGGDVEKDNAAATRMIQVLERYAQLPGAPTVLVSHHTRKGSRGDDSPQTVDDVRGASGLKDGARFVLLLEDQERAQDEKAPRLVKFSTVKNNYGPPPPDLWLTRDDRAHGALRRATSDELKTYREALQKEEVTRQARLAETKALAKAGAAKNGDTTKAGTASEDDYEIR